MEEKIKEWLRKQGYSLELKVASELGRQKIYSTLANFYKDPNTGQSRQIDVVGSFSDTTGFFQAELIIECKRSHKYPWLLLSADHSNDGFSMLFEYALTSDSARQALAGATITESIENLKRLPWMQWQRSRGVGIVPAFNEKGTDDAFKAVAGVMAASLARLKELEKEWNPMIFIFPVVIIDTDLFECKLNSSGDLNVQRIDEARLYFPMSFGDKSGACVHITTAKNLENFTADARRALEELNEFLAPASRLMADDFIKNIASI